MADNFQNLFDLFDKARVIYGLGQLDVTKMTGTLAHSLCTRLALELSVDGTEEGVV